MALATDTAARVDDGRHWARGDRRRQQLTNEFTDYLWGSATPPDVLFRAGGFAVRVPAEGVHGPAEPPIGSIYLYRRYLSFVSAGPEREKAAGAPGLVRLGARAYSELPGGERERLQAPLRRPGSLVVALSDVAEVRDTRWMGSPCLDLSTGEGVIRIGPDPSSGPFVQRATRWEPRLAALVTSLSGAGSPS